MAFILNFFCFVSYCKKRFFYQCNMSSNVNRECNVFSGTFGIMQALIPCRRVLSRRCCFSLINSLKIVERSQIDQTVIGFQICICIFERWYALLGVNWQK
ncbi:hypothetical protein T01_12940 [Trichinella spiralis]|uniref:Uncharacterized protein n=1 Tax=Trichinella spiralis TaxID=6334 RepID=A0A0V1B8L8_TRISP|nr:hypothetical protein T01_12940 [Trichinella spiralis]